MKIFMVILILLLPFQIFAQFDEYLQEDAEPNTERQGGVAFSVVESGTGLGGFYSLPVRGFWHLGMGLDVFLLRDKYQIDGYDYYYNVPYTINKKNNVYLIDLLFTAKKRLIPYEIDDSLRPYVAFSVGPVYGMNFPEQRTDPDGTKRENEYRWSLAGAAAAGVDVALDGGYLFGFRFQYRFMKFNGKLGERTDHSMFDIRLEIGKLLN